MSGAEIATTITDLVGTLVWPAVVLTIFLVLRRPLTRLIGGIKSLSVSAGGTDVTVAVDDATTALTAAATAKDGSEATATGVIATARTARSTAGRAAELLHNADGTTARRGLWVDDKPDNNRFERAALEALGIRFDLCRSTDEATGKLAASADQYSIIISDMSRPEGKTAGLTLLDWLREHGVRTPCVIYAGSATAQQIAETKEHGGVDRTNDPNALVEKVAAVIGSR